MSHSASKTRTAVANGARLPSLRMVGGIAAMALALGCGTYFWMNHFTAPDDSIVLQEADEFAPMELTETSRSGVEPARLATAGFDHVVSAVHRTPSDEQSTVQQIGLGASSRPESCPAAWLEGTIELGPAVEPSQWPYPAPSESRLNTFDRFSRR